MMVGDRLPRRVHLVGICGTGMTALACLLHEAGVKVRGSDAATFPPMSDVLAAAGIPVREGFTEENLDPTPDLVVLGNAVSRGNPEAEATLDRGLPYASLPEALARLFLVGQNVLAVAGTHGKTTTASLLAYLLDRGGAKPSFFIGGQPRDFPRPSRLGSGRAFVVEADEYDSAFFDKEPKFLHYRPRILVIGSVEYDHADIYPDLESILLRFRRLLRCVPRSGTVLLGADDPVALGLADHAFTPVQTFGLGDTADWRANEIEDIDDGQRFLLHGPGLNALPARLPLSGANNLRNALAAVAAAAAAGISPERAAALLGGFGGVRRRLELRAEAGGVRIYDDFAHHPTAVRGALEALRRREPGRRLVAVLEPRSNTMRRRVVQEELTDALSGADEVALAPVHRAAQVDPDDRLDTGRLAAELARKGIAARAFDSTTEMVTALAGSLKEGDTVLAMSNGGFDGFHGRLAEALGGRNG